MKARDFLLVLAVLSCSIMVQAIDYCKIQSEGEHVFVMHHKSPTYTFGLSKPYTVKNGIYSVCSGATMTISDIQVVEYVCENEMSPTTPADMHAWVYSNDAMQSHASNYRTLVGNPTREYVLSTSCAIPFTYGPGSSSMNVYTFNTPGDYTVYLYYVRAFIDEGCPGCYECPNHPTPTSHPCAYERRSWMHSKTYNVRVSNCATPTTTPTTTLPPTTTTVPQSNNAQYVSQSVPSPMCKGQSYAVSVTMKNTGTTTWTASGNYRLGSQNPQDNSVWGTGRVYLSSYDSIGPGASKTFSFTVTAPSTVGTYNFQWRMLRESVEWFGEYTPNVAVSVTNCATTTTTSTTRASTTTSMLSSLPDLVINDIYLVDQYGNRVPDPVMNTSNPSGLLYYDIKNIGLGGAGASQSSVTWLDAAGNPGSTFPNDVVPLPGSMVSNQWLGQYVCPTPGSFFYWKICADAGGAVAETYENNNCLQERWWCPLSSVTTTSSATTTTLYTPSVVTLKFNVTDDHSTKFNCSLWTNVSSTWRINQTFVDVNRLEAKYAVLYGVPEGTYGWTVNCTDGVKSSFPSNAVKSVPEIQGGGIWTFNVKKP